MSLCKRPTPVVAPPTVLLNLVLILPGAIAAFSCPTVQVFEGRRLVFDTTHDHANQVGVAGVAPARSGVPSCAPADGWRRGVPRRRRSLGMAPGGCI